MKTAIRSVAFHTKFRFVRLFFLSILFFAFVAASLYMLINSPA